MAAGKVARQKPVAKKRNSAKKIAEEVIEKAKGKKQKGAIVAADESDFAKGTSSFKIPGFDVGASLDDMEKKLGISSMTLGKNEGRLSTGLLGLDIVLGGGITAGWYTNFGKEQSCKSTGAMTFLVAAIKAKVPIIAYYDFEGSSEPDYVSNIMATQGLKIDVQQVFGIRNKEGKWLVKPRVRYNPEGVAEKFFDFLSALERALPDKIYESNEWWYVYEDTKENRKKLADEGIEHDMNKWRRTKRLYVPAEDGSLQALLITDSYPSMLPERLDNDDPKAGIGAVARMFSEQLPRVKGKMRRKRIAVIGVNQLRDRPMVMYGSPEYEPCGNAIKFYSDVRIKFSARAISAVPEAEGKGQQCEEPSVEFEGGTDTYRYVLAQGAKNKLSQPYLQSWLRLWITDGDNQARGFDPVWDTYRYLVETGQREGNRKKFRIVFAGNEAKKPMSWLQFKKLILGTKEEIKSLCVSLGMKPMLLRQACFKQMKSGEGLEMYGKSLSARRTAAKEKADSGDSDE